MEKREIADIVPALLQMSKLDTTPSGLGEGNRNAVEFNKLVSEIRRVLELFEKLDELENLPDEYLVHPTSDTLRYEVFNPENKCQSELLSLVPRTNGPFIQSPLVVDDDS